MLRPKSTLIKRAKPLSYVSPSAAESASAHVFMCIEHHTLSLRCRYDVHLNQTDIANNKNKYYIIQVMQD